MWLKWTSALHNYQKDSARLQNRLLHTVIALNLAAFLDFFKLLKLCTP
jgi:hypothetical protein